ncbi:MAG TPA: UMP kinase, partial [Ignavibacteria bacterium]|nr:UMP kinase [Ignavibacteria bacterium]
MKYNRILLKLSGEALLGKQNFGIDSDVVEHIADEIASIKDTGIEIGIVIGGGNI